MDPVVEKDLHEIGLHKIMGVDEAGRGPGAGPVVAAGVMLPANHKIEGLNDSKKLSPKKREVLADKIYEQALELHIAEVSSCEIDKINILNATKKCIHTVVNSFKITPNIVVIDGIFTFKDEYRLPYPYQTIPKGDSLSDNIAAASIIAKTYRDSWMRVGAHSAHPEYGFDKHVGYLTKQHIEALYKHGPCPLHRMSFSVKGVYIKDM